MVDSKIAIGLNAKSDVATNDLDWLEGVKVFDLESFSIYDISITELSRDLAKFIEISEYTSIDILDEVLFHKLKIKGLTYITLPVYMNGKVINLLKWEEKGDKTWVRLLTISVNENISIRNKNVTNMVTYGIVIDVNNLDFSIRFGSFSTYSNNPDREWNFGVGSQRMFQISSLVETQSGYRIIVNHDLKPYMHKILQSDEKESIVYGDLYLYMPEHKGKSINDLVINNGIKSVILDFNNASSANIVIPPSVRNILFKYSIYNDSKLKYKVYLKGGLAVNCFLLGYGYDITYPKKCNTDDLDSLSAFATIETY